MAKTKPQRENDLKLIFKWSITSNKRQSQTDINLERKQSKTEDSLKQKPFRDFQF